MKKPKPPNVTGTPGPRNPLPKPDDDSEVEEILRIADLLLGRQRASVRRCSGVQRFRKWG